MDLQEYLESSKTKRQEIIQVAARMLNKTTSGNIENKTKNVRNLSDNTFGPTVQKFKEFEEDVSQQLKRFFQPGLRSDESARVKVLKTVNIEQRIKKTYSNKSGMAKRKQLVMIPKSQYFSPVKVPGQIMQGKYMLVSPYTGVHHLNTHRNDTPNLENSKRCLTPVRLYNKSYLLQPILVKSGQVDKLKAL